MSSHFKHQQHLTPTNMAMIERALGKVRLLYEFERHSEDESQAAAVLIGEFQRGNTQENGLVAVFLGSDVSTRAMRKVQMRKSLERWENEGGARPPRVLPQAKPLLVWRHQRQQKRATGQITWISAGEG